MTVNELLNYCKEQIKLGNGNKTIYISDDDEGNGYHSLYFRFTDDKDDVKELLMSTCTQTYDDKIEDIIILG